MGHVLCLPCISGMPPERQLLPNQFESNACTAKGKPTNSGNETYVWWNLTRIWLKISVFKLCASTLLYMKLLAILPLLVVPLKRPGPLENIGANSMCTSQLDKIVRLFRNDLVWYLTRKVAPLAGRACQIVLSLPSMLDKWWGQQVALSAIFFDTKGWSCQNRFRDISWNACENHGTCKRNTFWRNLLNSTVWMSYAVLRPNHARRGAEDQPTQKSAWNICRTHLICSIVSEIAMRMPTQVSF